MLNFYVMLLKLLEYLFYFLILQDFVYQKKIVVGLAQIGSTRVFLARLVIIQESYMIS